MELGTLAYGLVMGFLMGLGAGRILERRLREGGIQCAYLDTRKALRIALIVALAAVIAGLLVPAGR